MLRNLVFVLACPTRPTAYSCWKGFASASVDHTVEKNTVIHPAYLIVGSVVGGDN